MSAVLALAGGGTGGHVMPALALAEALRSAGASVFVMGSERGLERRLVPEAGLELVALPARPFEGRGPAGRARALGALAVGAVRALVELRRRRVGAVVSVGGYAALPAVAAAVCLRLPLALVEPNARPGRANLLAARLARRVFCGLPATARALADRVPASRLEVTGVPLRPALVERLSAAPRRAPRAPFRLLVFGGSQGARQINRALAELAPELGRREVEVFHQTGAADRDEVAAAYHRAGVHARVVDFEPDMARRYAWADLAICRAGALTVAELCLARLPALLVPYPHAAAAHQDENARALAEAGAARVLPARPLDPARLGRELDELLAEPDTLSAMSAAAEGLARPDATTRIAEACLELAT